MGNFINHTAYLHADYNTEGPRLNKQILRIPSNAEDDPQNILVIEREILSQRLQKLKEMHQNFEMKGTSS